MIDLKKAEYLGDYKIRLTFEDGKSGVVDFASYIDKKGVFKKFEDLSFFKNFVIDPEVKTLMWGNEIDIAPEILYSQATHSCLPKWMQS
ncbi:MAG: DUF2442 domain-containing protein [Candidatus Omnitrophota bacterium]